jgi:hypothetical protein
LIIYFIKSINYILFITTLSHITMNNRYAEIIRQLDYNNIAKKTYNAIVLSNLNLGDDHEMVVLNDQLKKFPLATTLWFYNNMITDDSIESVVKSLNIYTNLTTIYLNNNKIEDEGAKLIANMLETTDHVTLLNLSFNSIGDEGAKHVGNALKQNTSLTTIYLDCNFMGKIGIMYILDAIKTNIFIKEIWLSTPYPITVLLLDPTYELSKLVCKVLKYNKNLNTFYVSGIEVDIDAINNILEFNGSITYIRFSQENLAIKLCDRNMYNLKLKAKRLVDL